MGGGLRGLIATGASLLQEKKLGSDPDSLFGFTMPFAFTKNVNLNS
jgi:hypothetical protein